MAFDDLRELVAPRELRLPIGGKTYVVEGCTAEAWLKLQVVGARTEEAVKRLRAGDDTPLEGEGMSQADLCRLTLGPAFDKMVKDGVTGQELAVAGYTAFYWHLGNEEMAETIWRLGGKAPAANRAARRAATKKTASRTSRATSASSRARTARS